MTIKGVGFSTDFMLGANVVQFGGYYDICDVVPHLTHSRRIVCITKNPRDFGIYTTTGWMNVKVILNGVDTIQTTTYRYRVRASRITRQH